MTWERYQHFDRLTLALILAVFACLLSLATAHAENRVALVVGNSAYVRIPTLSNPKNDAQLMAATLRGVGFEVVTAFDADRRDMARAVRTFGKKLRKAGKDAVGLFYYAGHGVQARGTNFLVPLGAEIETEADLEVETLSAANILAQMEDAGNTLNLLILDACRNNPFKGKVRSAVGGLARLNAASGSLVAFSAAPGQVAADGDGKNSPYTKALVEAIKQPGLVLEQMFKKVRVKVEAQTGGQQTPWEESSLKGDFHFMPPVAPKVPGGNTPAGPAKGSVRPIEGDVEVAFYRALEQDTLEEYDRFLTKFPDHSHAVTIRQIVKTRSDDKVWQRIKKTNTRAAYQQYLIIFPEGAYKAQANQRLAALMQPSTNPPVQPRAQPIPRQPLPRRAELNFYRVIDHDSWDVLNVRKGPSTKYGITYGIPYNATDVIVKYCRRVPNYTYSWCEIDHQGNRGWAYGKYLTHLRTGDRPH